MFAPFGGSISENTTSWRPEPSYRGTYGILSSCITTMVLCIWTSVHLNVPEPGRPVWHIFRKAGWLLCGLFAPEMVAWTAFQQYQDALQMTRKMKDVFCERSQDTKKIKSWWRIWSRPKVVSQDSEPAESLEQTHKEESKNSNKRYPWTIVHSHYALMGGFAFDAALSSTAFMPCNLQRLVLTPAALSFLAEQEPSLVPNLSKEHITDKSKANGLAKALVCMQASWFCVQCVIRLIQGLAISLLELNTFAHAICALLIYLLWWNKPLDVEESTLVQGEHTPEICALMIMADVEAKDDKVFEYSPTKAISPSLETDGVERRMLRKMRARLKLCYYGGNTDLNPDDVSRTIPASKDDTTFLTMKDFLPYGIRAKSNKSPIAESEDKQIQMYPGQARHGFRVGVEVRTARAARPKVVLELGHTDLNCLELAANGHRRYCSFKDRNYFKQGEGSQPFLSRRINEWPRLGKLNEQGLELRSKAILVGFTMAGLVYGAMHLIAWSAPFPTAAEQVLWRVSGIILVASGFILGLSIMGFLGGDFMAGFAYALFMLLALLYPAARVYLVVECFKGLTHLPEDAFLLPNWPNYWPHIV